MRSWLRSMPGPTATSSTRIRTRLIRASAARSRSSSRTGRRYCLRGVMYLGHLLVARRSLIDEVGGCDGKFDGVQDFELALRMSERTSRVEHIPRVLYHWRAIPGSVAADGAAKADIDRLQESAVQAHLDRVGIAATARRRRREPSRQYYPREPGILSENLDPHPQPRSSGTDRPLSQNAFSEYELSQFRSLDRRQRNARSAGDADSEARIR